MAKISVIGAGIVGRGWSIVFAQGGHEVALFDSEDASLCRAMTLIESALLLLEESDRTLSARETLARIRPSASLAAVTDGSIHVQECIPENAQKKTSLFSELDRLASPTAVLASSTSALPPSAFLSTIPGRHRCLVAHPANPPHIIPVVEVVSAPWTAVETTDACIQLLRDCGRTVIRLGKETPGFVFNRLQGALLAEAMQLVESGVVSADDVDLCIRDGLGFRWAVTGPFESMDLASQGGFAESALKYASLLQHFWPSSAPWRRETIEDIDRVHRTRHPLNHHASRELKRDLTLTRIKHLKEGR